MKKYMKEITDLGSPISPKLGKCSPRFRKKILNIVKKVHVICHDNGEDDEFKDIFDDKDKDRTRKNSLKDIPSLLTLKPHQRCLSMQVEPCTYIEEKTTKSHEITFFGFHNEDLQDEKIEKIYVVDFDEPCSRNRNLEMLNMQKISEEKPENDKVSSHNSEDGGDLPKLELNVHPRQSLKEELMGFDVSLFNFLGTDRGEHD